MKYNYVRELILMVGIKFTLNNKFTSQTIGHVREKYQ